MSNINSNPAAVSSWTLLKRAISAAAFTSVLAIIPAAMLPSTAMAGEYVEHFPTMQAVAADTGSNDESASSTVAVQPESLVYAVEDLLHTPHSQFTADGYANRWDESASDDWQVSLAMLKTGTLATPTRWAMVRYTRAIW